MTRTLLTADFAQIEARVLAWLAGQADLLKLFAEDGPIYEHMASKIYNKPINKKEHPKERQLGKTAVLGCFGPDTLVWTDAGAKRIVDVGDTDLVWDGEQWVRHQGLVSRGFKRVMTLAGVSVTPDHLTWTGTEWCTAAHLERNPTTLSRALATASASLRLSGTHEAVEAAWRMSWFSALVGRLRTLFKGTILPRVRLHGATLAPRSGRITGRSTFGGTPISSPMKRTGLDCSTGFLRAWVGAIGRTIRDTSTTVLAAFAFTPRGARIARLFSAILFLSQVGMSRGLRWIGLMSIAATSQGTSGLSSGQKTSETNDKSATCRSEYSTSNAWSDVYDLRFTGPKNRYTILTERGPLLVHNCGFGMGANKFRATCKKQGIHIDDALAKRTVDAYRQSNDRIKALWYSTEAAAIEAVQNPGKTTTAALGHIKYRMAGSFLWCQLPSGRCLCYPYPKVREQMKPWGEFGPELVYKGVNSYTRKFEEIPTYGGMLVENFVQAVARDLMADAMLRVERAGYPVILTVHDEVVSEVDKEKAEVKAFERLLAEVPPWARGCPVKAEGWAGERYRK